MQSTVTIKELLDVRNGFREKQQDLYISTISNINMRNRELLKNDFGSTLVKNIAWDVADTVVNRYFNTAEYHITIQQMVDRLTHFSYDNDIDPFTHNSAIRRNSYENLKSDEDFLLHIAEQTKLAQERLLPKEKKLQNNGKEKNEYVDKKIINDGKSQYKKEFIKKNKSMYDEITGKSADFYDKTLQVDHIQAAATATYNSRYIDTDAKVEALKKLMNSDKNFQLLNQSANGSKGDVRVLSNGKETASETKIRNELKKKYKDQGLSEEKAKAMASQEIKEKYTDVTYKATAEEYVEAVCDRWETAGDSSKNPQPKKNLQKAGILDENEKVIPEIKDRLLQNVKKSMNEESKLILKIQNYKKITEDSLEQTNKELRKSFKKIMIGQVIYYVLPPMIFETQTLLAKKNMTLDKLLEELKKSSKRIISYVTNQLSEIFKNIGVIALNKFIKNFFDIVIETVKETVKRLLKIIKQVVLSLVNCVKIICNKNSSPAEKADAVTKILSGTITTVLLEILFEWAEKQFGLPDIIMEPLQIIVTILTTNLIMLILQKADLFDVQYGLLVANMERIFEEENQMYMKQTEQILKEEDNKITEYINTLKNEINEIEDLISNLDLYKEDATENLNKINDIFDMKIDFDKEWKEFILA